MFQRPEYTIFRAAQPIIIDGRLDDPSWQGAPVIDLVLADSGAAPKQRTTARMLWDDSYLYVAFHCEDSDIWGTTREHDQDIYNQEVVEVFIDEDRDNFCYIELEVNPLNALFDALILNREGHFRGLLDWDSPDMRTAVYVDGDPTRRGTEDRSWTVEMAIPMTDLMLAPHIPPKPGDAWHINLYRIDRATWGDEYSAWSAPGRIAFHVPERFGRVVFSEHAV